MPDNKQNNTTELLVKLDGDVEAIEIVNVIDTLSTLKSILNEINREVDPAEAANIYVKPIREGSHEILLLISDPKNLATIITAYNLSKKIVEIFIDLNRLKKLLKGGKPTEVQQIENDKTRISNNTGDFVIVHSPANRIYSGNKRINNYIEKLYIINSRDEKVSDILFRGANEEVEVKREEFENMYKKNEIIEERIKFRDRIKNNIKLRIRKVIFESGPKWDFYYKGNRIIASIEDKNFLRQVNEDEIKFTKHLVLDVQLKIYEELDQKTDNYIPTKYEILHVNEVYNSPYQDDLFD